MKIQFITADLIIIANVIINFIAAAIFVFVNKFLILQLGVVHPVERDK